MPAVFASVVAHVIAVVVVFVVVIIVGVVVHVVAVVAHVVAVIVVIVVAVVAPSKLQLFSSSHKQCSGALPNLTIDSDADIRDMRLIRLAVVFFPGATHYKCLAYQKVVHQNIKQ